MNPYSAVVARLNTRANCLEVCSLCARRQRERGAGVSQTLTRCVQVFLHLSQLPVKLVEWRWPVLPGGAEG